MISVVMPVFNGEKYIRAALDSLDYPNMQVIVIDDGSDDDTVNIASDAGAQVISIKHSGPVCARNRGIEIAVGDYIMFMDADDIMQPNAMAEMRERIGAADVIIACRQDFISQDCNKIYKKTQSNYGVLAGCALIKREAFNRVGLLDEDLMCGDAYEWLLRGRSMGLVVHEIPIVTCLRRLHDRNMGVLMRGQEQTDYCKIIRKHFIKK